MSNSSAVSLSAVPSSITERAPGSIRSGPTTISGSAFSGGRTGETPPAAGAVFAGAAPPPAAGFTAAVRRMTARSRASSSREENVLGR